MGMYIHVYVCACEYVLVVVVVGGGGGGGGCCSHVLLHLALKVGIFI